MAGEALAARIRVHRPGKGADVPSFTLDLELEARPGITILFGPSGSGKSTVLQALAGLVRPDSGRIALGSDVWFDAHAGIDRPVHERHVAYVFQSLALFPHMTALGNVAYGVSRQVPRAERHARAMALLQRLGVSHLAHRRPRTFSGGEAQRVALARALAMSPRLVLLDEPFSALDRDLRIQLARLVRELVDEYRLPLIQVTHNHGEARALGDWVVRMAAGRVVEQGSVAQVLESGRAVESGQAVASGQAVESEQAGGPAPDGPVPAAQPANPPDGRRATGSGRLRIEDIDKTPMPELRS